MDTWVAAVVWGVAVLLLAMTAITGRMRVKHGVMAPAVTGHPMFERAYRVQMNTIEQAMMFLPAFLLAAHFGKTSLACIFGGIWILARVGYAITYLHNPRQRGPAFILGMLAFLALMAQSGWGILQHLLAA